MSTFGRARRGVGCEPEAGAGLNPEPGTALSRQSLPGEEVNLTPQENLTHW